LVRKTARGVALTADYKTAKAICDGSTIAAVEKLARSDRRVAARVNQFNTNHWLLNTPGGVVDLKTGKLQPHRAEDYMSLITEVAPSETADCPRFKAFLGEIMGNDGDLISYLQRLIGYCLTGEIREHVLIFGYGTGKNGKGVLINTLRGILGSYHKTAPMECFQETFGERHPTDLAMLQSRRLVTATETDEGKRWSESKIKTLTGGDQISARFMRQDFFQYIPAFKLFLTGNHKPSLKTVDEAIRRRFHLIPFAVTIPPERQDKDLGDKLRVEYPGILRWAIEGCLAWQRQGLSPPAAVIDATNDYLEAQDTLSQWIEERCNVGPNCWALVNTLYESWKLWGELAGEKVPPQRKFSEALRALGYQPERKGSAVAFQA
jgi:putative DNA primase/helicase